MKLGIALGGGGAKGLAHIGVLQCCRAAGIEFDVISGTSMGALVGAMYAAGALDDMEQEVSAIRLKDIPRLFSPTLSRSGIFSGKNVLELLTEYLKVERFEGLAKPFSAVSADLISGEAVYWHKGELLPALRASMSLPGIFTPVISGAQVLVDGGVVDPVPVGAAIALGAEFVVAVDLFGNTSVFQSATRTDEGAGDTGWHSFRVRLMGLGRKLKEEVLPRPRESAGLVSYNMITVLERTQVLYQQQLTQARFVEHAPDFLIQPPLGDVGFLDFHRAASIIKIGSEYASGILPQLQEILGSVRL